MNAPRWSQSRRILTVLGLNLALIIGLVIAGLLAHAVSVLAAAGDTNADCFALVLGLIAIGTRTIRTRNDPSQLPRW